MLGPRRYRPSCARFREPQPLNVFFGEGHGRIETDYGKVARHVQDGLDYSLPHLGPGVIQLRRIVPWEGGTVIAVVDVARFTGCTLNPFEYNGGIGVVVIM